MFGSVAAVMGTVLSSGGTPPSPTSGAYRRIHIPCRRRLIAPGGGEPEELRLPGPDPERAIVTAEIKSSASSRALGLSFSSRRLRGRSLKRKSPTSASLRSRFVGTLCGFNSHNNILLLIKRGYFVGGLSKQSIRRLTCILVTCRRRTEVTYSLMIRRSLRRQLYCAFITFILFLLSPLIVLPIPQQRAVEWGRFRRHY